MSDLVELYNLTSSSTMEYHLVGIQWTLQLQLKITSGPCFPVVLNSETHADMCHVAFLLPS